MLESESKILQEYWMVSGLEESLPFQKASEKDKKTIEKGMNFARFMLRKRVVELRTAILKVFKK